MQFPFIHEYLLDNIDLFAFSPQVCPREIWEKHDFVVTQFHQLFDDFDKMPIFYGQFATIADDDDGWVEIVDLVGEQLPEHIIHKVGLVVPDGLDTLVLLIQRPGVYGQHKHIPIEILQLQGVLGPPNLILLPMTIPP